MKKRLVASLFFLFFFYSGYSSLCLANNSLFPLIVRSSIDTFCNQDNSAYLVRFNIEQGDINSYSVLGPGTLFGDLFISDFIPSGDPFNFIVSDVNQCGADTISGDFTCLCQSQLGVLDVVELYLCSSNSLRATDYYDPAGQVIVGNDVRNYVMSTSDVNPIGQVVLANSSGIFFFDETTMSYGQTYYVMAVIGDRLGIDSADLADQCLQMSGTLSVTWFDEINFLIASSQMEITCDDPVIQLIISTNQDTAGYSVEWNAENGGVIAVLDSARYYLNVDVAGRYVATISHPLAGCETTAIIDIIESSELPTAVIAEPEVLTCALQEITLSGIGSAFNQNIVYEWSGPGIIGQDNTIEVLINEPGIYFLTVRDTLNICEVNTRVSVIENVIAPAIVLSNNEKIDCETEWVAVSGQGSSVGLNFIYEWSVLRDSGNIISPVVQRDILVDAPGLYELMVTNVRNGCTSSDSIWVEYDENYIQGADIMLDQPACSGASDGSIDILEVIGGTAPITFSFDGGLTLSESPFLNNLPPGIYPILIQDAKGCAYAETVILTAPFDFFVDLGADQILGQGADVFIEAQTDLPDSLIKSIVWSPTIDSLNGQSLFQQFSPALGFYPISITVENNNGCVETDQINIILKFEKRVYIPSVIYTNSLNNDNKFFNIYSDTASVASIPRFEIYDRWGSRVFQRLNIPISLKVNPEFAWNGTKGGEALDAGVFVYRLEINYVNGQREVIIGDVTLMR